MRDHKIRIAIAAGDPAGIGPEIALKTALDPALRAACTPVIVCDRGVLARHAKACGIAVELAALARATDADGLGQRVYVLDCPMPELADLGFGARSAAAGRGSIAFCRAAVKAALGGEVDAVVGAPQDETSVALAGIAYDGHPSFVARETATDPDDVLLMLCFGKTRIAHVTLHKSVREAVGLITCERVVQAIRTTAAALKRLDVAAPRLCVSGLNPHAGEDGLFGREEIEVIKPAIETAAAEGIAVVGPVGADLMFGRAGVDAFVVMLHDQGHIAAKLLAPHAAAAMTIGTPILFASVAHGSAHDIAGKGVADATAMREAVMLLARARSS